MPKTSSIRSAVSIEHRLVTDTDTDGHRLTASTYRGCTASRGKTRRLPEPARFLRVAAQSNDADTLGGGGVIWRYRGAIVFTRRRRRYVERVQVAVHVRDVGYRLSRV